MLSNHSTQLQKMSVVSAASRPHVGPLDKSWFEAICELEPVCYASPWSAELIAQEFDKPISHRLGLFENAQLRGYMFNYLLADELHILNIAVHPRYRLRGYGRLLLSEALSQAASREVVCATLEVRVSNIAAQSLYQRLGFRIVGTRKAYYRNNGEDALILELQIARQDLRIYQENRENQLL